MGEPTPSPRIGLVLGSPSSGAEGVFVQGRMAVFGAIATPLTVAFYVVVNVLAALGARSEAGWLSLPNLAILWVGAVFGVMWLVCRGRQRSEGVLRALDVAVTLGAALGCAVHGWAGEATVFQRFDGVLAVTNILVMRATLVPSTARRTAVVGALAMVPVVSPAWVSWALGEGSVPGDLQLSVALLTGWGLVSVVGSTTVSHVVHGLHNKVREAQQLGQYRLVSKLGQGGMGEVYLARHALLRRPTAIKLLRPELAGESAIAAFEREVQLSSQLTHPNTVQIHDYGRTPDGIFYYAMEYLPGIDLETLVRRHGPLPPARVIHVLRQVCASLAEAHDAGLVHRDVKAANAILCQRGGMPDVVKLLDFGLVREVGGEVAAGDRGLCGTPTYLAPEAIEDPAASGPRTDLYAVGALGYWLVSGRMPIEGGNATEVLARQMFMEPRPPSEVAETPVPSDLEDALMHCLAKAPADRPRGVRALDRALARCADAGAWGDDEARDWWKHHGVRSGPPTSGIATAATLMAPPPETDAPTVRYGAPIGSVFTAEEDQDPEEA